MIKLTAAPGQNPHLVDPSMIVTAQRQNDSTLTRVSLLSGVEIVTLDTPDQILFLKATWDRHCYSQDSFACDSPSQIVCIHLDGDTVIAQTMTLPEVTG